MTAQVHHTIILEQSNTTLFCVALKTLHLASTHFLTIGPAVEEQAIKDALKMKTKMGGFGSGLMGAGGVGAGGRVEGNDFTLLPAASKLET